MKNLLSRIFRFLRSEKEQQEQVDSTNMGVSVSDSPIMLLKSGRYWDASSDPYKYQRAADNNREVILNSDICGCIGCGEIYSPSEITKWWDDGATACCPKCGMTSVVVGAASGLAIDIEMLEMAGAHVVH